MFGGFNIVISLVYRMVNLGVFICFIFIDLFVDVDEEFLWKYMMNLLGIYKKLLNVEIVDVYDCF